MFQISRYSRSLGVLAAASLTGIALAACSPQLEQPSTEKVDTALEQDADTVGGGATSTTGTTATATGTATTTAAAGTAEVSFVDCVSAPAEEPRQVTLDCSAPANAVTAITWSEWDEDEATGTGTNQVTGLSSEVVLSSPEEGTQGLVFTEITVDGTAVTP